ncbi:MAG: hypothetical protein ABI811_01385 [Acidobacteriota bacterium]
MDKRTGIIFKVNFIKKTKSLPKQEGFVQLWQVHGELRNGKQVPFDYPDELPRKMRLILKAAGIPWPRQQNTGPGTTPRPLK